MARKGILLAGGAGTRLHPLTLAVSKQLLPVFDKPMVYYPLSLLMLAGIRDILIISTPDDVPLFRRLLGDGSPWGISLSYAVQPRPEGIAQAIMIGADFLAGDPCCLVLGDNILYGGGLEEFLMAASERTEGATVVGYHVEDPERYGVVSFGPDGRANAIIEKPKNPASSWAVIGLYYYDGTAAERVQEIRPSDRQEYEITALNNHYLADGELAVERLGRGYAWFDTGTHVSLLEAGEFVRVLQTRQGQLIASPEEIAFRKGWMSADELTAAGERLGKTAYGRSLIDIARGR